MKSANLILAVTIFVTATMSWANAGAGCYDELLASTNYKEPNERQRQCLLEKEEFAQAITILCSENQTKLSAPYLQYLAIWKKTEKALFDYQSATDRAGRELAFKNLMAANVEKERSNDEAVRTARGLYSNAIEYCLAR